MEDVLETYISIWCWDKKRHLIETNDPEKVNQIAKWSFATVGPSYGVNHYRRQFFIPRKKVRLAHKLLGLEYKKHPSRVKAGKQAAKNHPVRRG